MVLSVGLVYGLQPPARNGGEEVMLNTISRPRTSKCCCYEECVTHVVHVSSTSGTCFSASFFAARHVSLAFFVIDVFRASSGRT